MILCFDILYYSITRIQKIKLKQFIVSDEISLFLLRCFSGTWTAEDLIGPLYPIKQADWDLILHHIGKGRVKKRSTYVEGVRNHEIN
jgi:hypothetical protein